MLFYVHIGFCVLFVRYNLLDLLSEIFFNEKEILLLEEFKWIISGQMERQIVLVFLTV